MVAAAVIGAGVVGAAGSVAAGSMQAGAQEQSAATQQGMFNTITSQEQPFMKAGVGATNRLADLLGTSGNSGAAGYGSLTSNFTPQDFQNNLDPGYQWQLEQGQQAVRNSDTPAMGALSGAALKDLIGFNQGMASTGYQNAFNRYQSQQNNIFARLSGIAGLGQNAASNTGTAGTALGQGIGQAQARAGAAMGAGVGNAFSSVGNGMMLSQFLNQPDSTDQVSAGANATANNFIDNYNSNFETSPVTPGG